MFKIKGSYQFFSNAFVEHIDDFKNLLKKECKLESKLKKTKIEQDGR